MTIIAIVRAVANIFTSLQVFWVLHDNFRWRTVSRSVCELPLLLLIVGRGGVGGGGRGGVYDDDDDDDVDDDDNHIISTVTITIVAK